MLAERRLQSQFRMLFTVTPEKPLAFILRVDLHTLYLLYKSRSLVIYREFYFRYALSLISTPSLVQIITKTTPARWTE